MSKQWNFKENAETIYMERSPKGLKNYFSQFLKWACFANKLFFIFFEKHVILQNNFAKQFVFLGVEIWGPKTQIV